MPDNKRFIFLFISVGILSCEPQPVLRDPQGQGAIASVVKVADGDTITVQMNGRTMRIRLSSVDAPERDQPYGPESAEFTTRFVLWSRVQLEVVDRDHYGRLVALVKNDKGSLNEALLSAGLAWFDVAHQIKQLGPRYAELQDQSRSAKRGLWAQPNPTAPWHWRRAKRTAKRDGVPQLSNKTSNQKFSGNTRSKVFHQHTCSQFNCPHCTRFFDSVTDAVAQGFRPHRHKACIAVAP